ncbi:MAG: S8 family serine peptidase [Ardenticatenaceae bacterium]|nr:S8 family serine peptidase [Ardenticatenaceae bacterium]
MTVAVVDTGIDIAEHPRLVGRYDALNNGSPKFDPHGHGTMMASLIGNETQFDGKYLGIAPETNLVDVRVLDANGQGEYSDIIEGLDWILQNKDTYDIRIVNLSLVAGINSPYWADPLDQAVEALWDAGLSLSRPLATAGRIP